MVEIIEKQQFSVIGKMEQGEAIEGAKWIPLLWQVMWMRNLKDGTRKGNT